MTDLDNDIDEAKDWQGRDIDCGQCEHTLLLADNKCELKRACVHDRYARRIDRFFDWNPGLANRYLTHAHFEVRAIAAKHADVFSLPPLLKDPDETVRWNAVRRLPTRYLLDLRQDPHREVRIRVAQRLGDADLVPMMSDPDYYVRLVIARRISPALLLRYRVDPEPEVRRVVATRIGPDWAATMAGDEDAGVRLEVARNISPALLDRLKEDDDWRVRHAVASRIDGGQISFFLKDPDPMVREAALSRLSAVDSHGMRLQ